MLMIWPPYRRRVLAEADEYIESFGQRAHEQCRTDGREAMLRGDHRRARFLGEVRAILRKKLLRDDYLDTATRYLEPRSTSVTQAPYDHGPGYFTHRPKDLTLH